VVRCGGCAGSGGIPYELQAGFGPYGGDALTGKDEKPLGYPVRFDANSRRTHLNKRWHKGKVLPRQAQLEAKLEAVAGDVNV
jgi:hypothetical protein